MCIDQISENFRVKYNKGYNESVYSFLQNHKLLVDKILHGLYHYWMDLWIEAIPETLVDEDVECGMFVIFENCDVSPINQEIETNVRSSIKIIACNKYVNAVENYICEVPIENGPILENCELSSINKKSGCLKLYC